MGIALSNYESEKFTTNYVLTFGFERFSLKLLITWFSWEIDTRTNKHKTDRDTVNCDVSKQVAATVETCFDALLLPCHMMTRFFLFNRPFPICRKPLFQREAKCGVIDRKPIFILMQTKLIFTGKVLYLASFWKCEFLELGNRLFSKSFKTGGTRIVLMC